MSNTSELDSDTQRSRTPRRLPPVPSSSRSSSRPLPHIPRAMMCKKCQTCITSSSVVLPPSLIPPKSRTSFKGFSGSASLFMETYNVVFARAKVQLMATGAHTMQEINCATCLSYLGWKIVRAHEPTERWKEGNCLLELENLYTPPDTPRHSRASSSDTDSDCGS